MVANKTLYSVAPLTDREFNEMRALIHREAGIHLSNAKKALLTGRLIKRVATLGFNRFGDYYRYLQESRDPNELTRMLDCVCTNETHFFREPQHFQFLEEQLFPVWKERGGAGSPHRVSVWSAACSTGEEPYTLAMVLSKHFPMGSGWTVEILATDLSTRVLSRAREGLWPIEKASEIPTDYLHRFMLRGTNEDTGRMSAGLEIRKLIRFCRYNLMRNDPIPGGPFDLIFCRNVMIYFDSEGKKRVVRQLLSKLHPDGYFFSGHAESLADVAPQMNRVATSVYRIPRATA